MVDFWAYMIGFALVTLGGLFGHWIQDKEKK